MTAATTGTAPNELTTPTRSFIYGLADEAGYIHAGSLFTAAEAAGFSTTKLRLAIKRMSDTGLLTSSGRGRKADIQLTGAGLDQRRPDLFWTAFAYRLDAGLHLWDGQWHLAAFEIPEQQRAARDALRNQIRELFGASLSSGLYLSPYAWEPWLITVAEAHDVSHRVTIVETATLHHGGTSDRKDIAASLWPIHELDTDYQRFIDRWEPVVTAVPDDEAAAVRIAFEAAAQFAAVFGNDPLLPTELLPSGFAGPPARQLYIDLANALNQHEILARASLFGAHRTAVENALTVSEDEFWNRAVTRTART